jgi:Nucleoside 2-deoxyribosyltransferase like
MSAPRAQVFLGGACGHTTWRRDVAVPRLEAAGVGYFDPQLAPGAWTPAHEARDDEAKAAADVLLVVIHEATRGVAGIAEAVYLLAAERPLALYVGDVPDGAAIDGRVIDARERDDLNRGRLFLRTMAAQRGVPVHASIAAATDHAITLARAARPGLSLAEVRAVLAEVSYRDFELSVEARGGGYELRLRRTEPDADTGAAAAQAGRRWPIERTATRGEIVQTALKAALTWEEHAAREGFRYQGERVFGPHLDVDALAALAGAAPKR